MQGTCEALTDIVDWDEVRRRILEDSDMDQDAPAEEPPGGSSLSLDLLFDDMAPESSSSKSALKREAVLKERALALAQVPREEVSDGLQLVAFSLSNEKYAIPTANVQEVQPLQNLCPVPCVPSFVVGVINIRGTIYSVIDIRSFLGLPAQGPVDAAKVIMVNAAGLGVGVLADDVLGAVNVPPSRIKPPLAAQSRVREEYIQGVTEDMMIILNLEALMRDERIIVHEEVA